MLSNTVRKQVRVVICPLSDFLPLTYTVNEELDEVHPRFYLI